MSKKKCDNEISLSKYQSFAMVRMARGDIREAPYNPRKINKEAQGRLKGKMRDVGLVQPLIVNRRTGNLVSGHQRLAVLDKLERGREYELDVSVIDVDERVEKEMVVFLNNPSSQGEWDLEGLAALNLEHGIDFDSMGFEQFDVEALFDGDARFAEVLTGDDPEIEQTGERLREVKEARAAANDRMAQRNEEDFYVVVVCRDQGEKDALMRRLGVPVFERFVRQEYVLAAIERAGGKAGPVGGVGSESQDGE